MKRHVARAMLLIAPIASAQHHPDWLKHAAFYQIYPPSFQDSDGNGIGDIAGMDSRLQGAVTRDAPRTARSERAAHCFGDSARSSNHTADQDAAPGWVRNEHAPGEGVDQDTARA